MSTVETQPATGGALAAPRSQGRSARAGRFSSWGRVSLAIDAAALALALFVDHFSSNGTMAVAWTFVFAALVIGLLATKLMYRPPIELRMLDATRSIVTAVAVAAAITIVLRGLFTDASAVAKQMIELWLLATVFVLAGRIWLISSERRARRRGEAGQRTLIVGAGNVGRLVAKRLVEHPEVGLTPVGFLDKEPLHGGDATGLPVLGASWDLDGVVLSKDVEHVIVTFSTAPEEVHLRLLKRCDELGIGTSVVPRLYEKSTERVIVVPLGGVPLVARQSPNPRSWQFAVKHGLDRVGAALALLVLSPVLGALAIAVWISLGRPILYSQERVGRDGRRFRMFKFRSMWSPSEDESVEVVVDSETAPGGVEGADRRTRLGAFMRRTSLDELPQLLNVVKGEMSFIGPRPERPVFAEVFERDVHRYEERHRVKSGITGWSQVNGLRGNTSLADRVEWDNYYIDNWSLWLDFKITLMTLVAVVRSAEAE